MSAPRYTVPQSVKALALGRAVFDGRAGGADAPEPLNASQPEALIPSAGLPDWIERVPLPREAYEGASGGWADGRLGQSYDLIGAARYHHAVGTEIHRLMTALLAAVEDVDAEIRESFSPGYEP